MPGLSRLRVLACASSAAWALAVLAAPVAVHADEEGGGGATCERLSSAPGSAAGPLTAVELGYVAATNTAQYRLRDTALPAGTGITYEIRACEWYENDGDRVADAGSRTASGRFDETTTLVATDVAGAAVLAGAATLSVHDPARVPTATPPFLICMRAELIGSRAAGGGEGSGGDGGVHPGAAVAAAGEGGDGGGGDGSGGGEAGGVVVVDHLGNTLCFNPAIAVPPPVTLAEAPVAVLLPGGALAVFAGAIGLSWRRQRDRTPPARG